MVHAHVPSVASGKVVLGGNVYTRGQRLGPEQ